MTSALNCGFLRQVCVVSTPVKYSRIYDYGYQDASVAAATYHLVQLQTTALESSPPHTHALSTAHQIIVFVVSLFG